MKMKLSKVGLVFYYSLLCCVTRGPFNGQANAENALEHNSESIPNEDTPQFHNQKHERRHLLAHLADRMDLDGEGLRHIQKHLGELTGESEQNQDVKDVAAGDNAKGIFYFFKLHDYDDNQKLDGLEWMQALTDFHQEDNDKGEFKEGGRVFLEHEAEAIVDELLTKHDIDDDGMIDFLELMNSKVDSFMTDLDKPVPGEEGDEQQQQQNVEEHSSLEQEFNQRQQGQQSSEQNEPQDNQQQQDQQEHQQQQEQQEHNSEETQGDQEQQGNQQQSEPSLEDEYNQQHKQQEDQQQEQNQQEQNTEETQGDQEQQGNQQQNESSLEDEYNQQHKQQEDQQRQQNQQEQNTEEIQGDQEQQGNQQQNEPSLEDEYNQKQQQQQ